MITRDQVGCRSPPDKIFPRLESEQIWTPQISPHPHPSYGINRCNTLDGLLQQDGDTKSSKERKTMITTLRVMQWEPEISELSADLPLEE